MEELLSAQEIADKRLPGFPSTKAAIHAMALREGWYFEKRTGVGGTRRVYRVPQLVRANTAQGHAGRAVDVLRVPGENGPALIAAGTKADPELLALAVQAVEEWCQETGKSLSPGRKGSVIAVLYDYLTKGGGQAEVKTLLQAVG